MVSVFADPRRIIHGCIWKDLERSGRGQKSDCPGKYECLKETVEDLWIVRVLAGIETEDPYDRFAVLQKACLLSRLPDFWWPSTLQLSQHASTKTGGCVLKRALISKRVRTRGSLTFAELCKWTPSACRLILKFWVRHWFRLPCWDLYCILASCYIR
jgi:hypothetical protein